MSIKIKVTRNQNVDNSSEVQKALRMTKKTAEAIKTYAPVTGIAVGQTVRSSFGLVKDTLTGLIGGLKGTDSISFEEEKAS